MKFVKPIPKLTTHQSA